MKFCHLRLDLNNKIMVLLPYVRLSDKIRALSPLMRANFEPTVIKVKFHRLKVELK